MIQNEEARRQDTTEQEQEQPAPAAETGAGAETEDPGAGAALAEARAEAETQRELALRAAAELQNVRRRAERDVENAHRYGVERFARELLAVKDSLEMGLQATEGGRDDDPVVEGVRATLKLLEQCFEKHGIGEIDPAGSPFDPEAHEAMATQPSADTPPDTVLMVVQKGYRLHERLLRPARVIVARAAD